jgi:hypothetical protein
MCISFMRGLCTRGDKCKFSHGEDGTVAAAPHKPVPAVKKAPPREAPQRREQPTRQKSQYPGVQHEPTRWKTPWKAVAKRNGKRHYIGYYATEEEAAAAKREFDASNKI